MRIAWHQHTLTQGERNTLLCLRRTYGPPNPILVYYNLADWSIRTLVNALACLLVPLANLPACKPENSSTSLLVCSSIRQLVCSLAR